MNLANKLTLMRVILVPFFVAFMLIDAIPLNYLWALLVFAIASITDMLDGKIARKYNMITSFGKFLDSARGQDTGRGGAGLFRSARLVQRVGNSADTGS